MISHTDVDFVKSAAIVAMEKLRGSWHEMPDEWRAYTGGWCLGYSQKLDKILAVFGIEFDDDEELVAYLEKRYG